MKKLHETVQQQIRKKNEQYATKANKGRQKVIFQYEEWVWVYLRKERFSSHRHSKLNPRGDGPFQVLERINDNAYKIHLLGEYNVGVTFNVFYLSFKCRFKFEDESFGGRGNDGNMGEN